VIEYTGTNKQKIPCDGTNKDGLIYAGGRWCDADDDVWRLCHAGDA